MPSLVRLGLRQSAFIVLILLVALATTNVRGQDKKIRDLHWSHAFDLASRKFGEASITKETKRWGVEAFFDDNTNLGLYISQTGSFAVAPNFQGLTFPITPSKGPEHITGLDLPTRKAGVREFKKDTKVHSIEVFRDPNVDNYLFITEAGNVAATTGKLFPGAANKTPKWIHSVDLKVRKGGVKDWSAAAKIGIEVYRDGNSGNLVFISEQGNIAVIPDLNEVKADKPLAPDWLHGLDVACRRFDEKTFTKETRKFGVEVYHDLATANLIFICETGSIAVIPAGEGIKAPTSNIKEPRWTHGLNAKARERGEELFSEKTRAFGAEIFLDVNVNAILYVNELGNIAAAAK